MGKGWLTAVAALPFPEEIQRIAREVITSPDYHIDDAERDLTPVFEKIMDWLRSVFSLFAGVGKTLWAISPLLTWLLIIVLLLLLVLLTWHIIYTFRRALAARGLNFKATDLIDKASLRPEFWETRARQAAEQRDYILAARHLLRAGLLRLEAVREHGLRRGATNREYLRRYAATPVAEPLSLLVETIDLKWYGDSDCGEEDWRRCAQAHERIQALAGETTDAQRA